MVTFFEVMSLVGNAYSQMQSKSKLSSEVLWYQLSQLPSSCGNSYTEHKAFVAVSGQKGKMRRNRERKNNVARRTGKSRTSRTGGY